MLVPIAVILYQTTSELRTPLQSGQLDGSQWCPQNRGFTVHLRYSQLTTSVSGSNTEQVKSRSKNCKNSRTKLAVNRPMVEGIVHSPASSIILEIMDDDSSVYLLHAI